MTVFPQLPEPTYPLDAEAKWKTLTTDFESGTEMRRQVWTFPKRIIKLQYEALEQWEIDALYNFFMQRKGALESFYFLWPVMTESGTWQAHSNEYVGRGDGAMLIFDIPGRSLTPSVVGTDLIVNGAFETDPTVEWLTDQCTIASVAGGNYGNCLEVTRSGWTYQGAYQDLAVEAGKTYRIKSAVRAGSSGQEPFEIMVFSPGYAPSVRSGVAPAGWTYFEITHTAETATLRVYLKKNSATAGTMLFDTVTVFEVPAGGLKVYENGVERPFTLLPGSGDGGVDRVQFANPAPAAGSIIVADFTGQIRYSVRFTKDVMSKEMFKFLLYNTGLELIEVRS